MQVYRICHQKWANSLRASGNAARWNPKGRYVIYTSASKALACLENVVHRSGEGLHKKFKVLTIQIPPKLKVTTLPNNTLTVNWQSFSNYHLTQQLGNKWIASSSSAVLKVPSAIINGEFNYLLNSIHSEFNKIRIIAVDDFLFDSRLSQ